MLKWVDYDVLPHCVGFAGPGADPIVFVGRTDGMIVPARGEAVFGWGKPCLMFSVAPPLMAYAIRSNGLMHCCLVMV